MRPLDVVRELARRVSQDRIPLSALIVIGSAAREGDFVEGLSDIDVVVVQDEPDPEIEDRIRAIASEVDPAISLVILDRARLGSIFRAADALSFLIKAGTPLVIDGPTRRIVRQAVRPTGATVWRLRASARAALRLAFEAHYARDYKRAIVHAYHALRHAIRAQAAAKGAFPVSDAEVLEAAEGDRVKAAYGLLVSLRRNYKSAAKNPPLVRNAVVLSDRLVDLLTGAGRAVPVDGLARIRYARAICYPDTTLEGVMRRVDQLRALRLDAIEFAGDKLLDDLPVLGKGCVSVVVVGRRGRERYAVKIRRTDADRRTMEREAEMQRIANSVGVGPKLHDHTSDVILMELVEGRPFPEWIEGKGPEDREIVGRSLREALEGGWKLDSVGLDHGELSRAPKHIMVDAEGHARIIDFETASNTRRPRNVTSLAQYFFLKGTVAKHVQGVVGEVNRDELIDALRRYKGERNRDNFERILAACRLAVVRSGLRPNHV